MASWRVYGTGRGKADDFGQTLSLERAHGQRLVALGAWRDEDTDRLVHETGKARGSNRPPVVDSPTWQASIAVKLLPRSPDRSVTYVAGRTIANH